MNYESVNYRQYWIEAMLKIAHPVLSALSERRLRELMPVEHKKDIKDRGSYTYLEALGRTLAGIAPWLELSDVSENERKIQQEYAELAREAIDAATDPNSPDYMNFTDGHQPIVDAAFLAHAILRAPNQLWGKLGERVKKNLVNALKATRENRKPYFCNWLLFSGMIETALYIMGEQWDHMRVDYCIMQHRQWYCGDGVYSDGFDFHWDYYNSFVIQPMLVDITLTLGKHYSEWEDFQQVAVKRMQRYSEVLERMISPEGTYPIIGRSLAYRFGAFQALSQIALMHKLPDGISPMQVRCALSAVIKRTMESCDNFDENGWLKIGLIGSQPNIGETYISTGSLYLCSTVFLPLGLPPNDDFWSGPDEPWSAKKAWSGADISADNASQSKLIFL